MKFLKRVAIALLFISIVVAGLIGYTLLEPARSLPPAQEEEQPINTAASAGKRTGDTAKGINQVRKDTTQNRDSLSANYSAEAEFRMQKDGSRPIRGNVRRINIAIIGVDARMGTNTRHADANHILSIVPDSGVIEIISIPRDTPADAGMPDSSGLNKLTIVHANRGIRAYLSEAARIAGIGRIDYYAELGFSQAMGIIELLGHRDSKSTLQVLRSRTGLGGDDFQRCYNQGQYIRQMILSHFHRATGILGDLLIRGGLTMVETNMNTDLVKSIISELKENGFPRDSGAITVRVRPGRMQNFKVYDFTDSITIQRLRNKIERYNLTRQKKDSSANAKLPDIAGKLENLLSAAARDTARKPKIAINRLMRYFDQHAWLQVQKQDRREEIRERFADMLFSCWMRLNKPEEARKVRHAIELEKELFKAARKN
jgi:hypothetical protein